MLRNVLSKLGLKKRRGSSDELVDTLLCEKPNFAATEAYKLLRTNLSFALPDEGKCKVIGISSAIRAEAKSTTAINLSYVIAEGGKKVLLIDGDLRLPSVAKKLGIKSTPGLSEAILHPSDEDLGIQTYKLDNWHILPSGSIPPNPSELLGSKNMEQLLDRFAGEYDYIIIDLPPVNVVSDALTVSPNLSGMLVVVRSNYSKRREVNRCLRSLGLARVRVLGIVMTAKPLSGLSYSKKARYKSNYHYRYGYGYGKAHELSPGDKAVNTEEAQND